MGLILGVAFSMHIGLGGGYNNIHPHIGYEEKNIIGGVYHNSLDKTSVYVAKPIDLTNNSKLDVGLVSGYLDYPAVPMIRYRYDITNHTRFFVIPGATRNINNIGLVTGLEITF
jgi:hypothetical protein